MEEENKRGFKVDDRRRFSAEGELKPEHRGEEAARSETAPDPAAQHAASAATAGVQVAESAVNPGATSSGAAGAEITFATFMVGLSTQALVLLGEIPDPNGDVGGPNLPAAQQLIDIVGMLHEKTRGNLDHDEQELLEGILFELRVKYVERKRRGAG
jgi:hypothetical protein